MRRLTNSVSLVRHGAPAILQSVSTIFSSKASESEDDDNLLKKKPFVLESETQPAGSRIRPLSRLKTVLARETYEESIKEELPPKPRAPRGWLLNHTSGTNFFSLTKNVHIEGSSGPELLTVVAKMETKVPDMTYNASTGERTEQQHLVFYLFVQRVYDGTMVSQQHKGGLEFILTSIDAELVLDGLVVHSSEDELNQALSLRYASSETNTIVPFPNRGQDAPPTRKKTEGGKFARYRGPYMNELDEELTDEIFDYLDDRGINNAFADFVMAQAHFTEQEEYVHWLKLLKEFAKNP